jgi:DNA-binding winged helix-turn-helix (wHTH) protein
VRARFGVFDLDSERRQLLRDGGEIHLTPKAFDLLALLVAEAPRVVRKNELHERLWPGTFVSDATLTGLVKEVRRALDDRDAASPLIRTAHGVGYAFAHAMEVLALDPPAAVTRWVVVGARRIPLADGEHVIGRDPAAAIHVDTSGVSRRHARIVVSGSTTSLEDLASKNGTRLNDVAVAGRAALHDGDRIQLGASVILFKASTSGISTDTIVPLTRR